MEIHKGIDIIDLALSYKDHLIISDLHIGLEEALNKEGILVPRFQLEEILKRLEKIFSKSKTTKKLVINGDLKHEFGEISRQEWRDTLKVLDFITQHNHEIILIKGNHDTILGPIAEKRNVKVVDFYQIDDITILHGNKIIPALSKILIIGHEHPSLSFKERRGEKFKCFLKGKWKNKTIIVLPSFNFVTEGYDIAQEAPLSPFLKSQYLGNFEVFIVEPQSKEGALYFGKFKDIKKL